MLKLSAVLNPGDAVTFLDVEGREAEGILYFMDGLGVALENPRDRGAFWYTPWHNITGLGAQKAEGHR